MCCSAQSYPGTNLGKLLKKFWLFFAGLSLVQICHADSSTSPSWVKGPTRVSLGDYGQLDLPAGYKFADGQSAAALLKISPTSGSGKLLGVVMPLASEFSLRGVSGDWYMTFEYFDTGHVNDMHEWQINDSELLASLKPRIAELNQVRDGRGQPPLRNVDWQIKPTYNVDTRSIQWALKGDGVSAVDTVLDYANRFLTRRGVLQARATVLKGGTIATAWIQDLVSALSIKTGETYADFQSDDKTASAGLATLAKETPSNINIPKGPASVPDRAVVNNVGGMKAFWIIVAVLGCVGIVGGGLLARRFRQYRGSKPTEPIEAEAPAPAEEAVAAHNGNGNGNGHSNGLKLNGHGLKFARSPKPARARSNGSGALAKNGNNGNGNGKDMKRKRMFNYHKFYTEMVLQGPSPVVADNYSAYELDPYTAAYLNGYGASNGNGNGNGHRNNNGNGNNGNGHHGNGNGHAANGNGTSGAEAANGSSSNAILSAAHNDLIATQRGLIEEQKRLIQEQSRLIEEKTKLLAEKDRLMERQSQLFGNQPS